jgi:hypothetical protein
MNVQDQAVATANDIFGALQQLTQLLGTVTRVNGAYNQLNMAAVFDAMPTVAQNPDGTLGAPDAAPVVGHPIDISKVTLLKFAVSGYDIGVMLTLLQQLSALLQGNTVAQQTAAPVSLAKVTSD